MNDSSLPCSESTVYGIVYLLTCQINGKVYVGQTTTSVDKRWRGHLKAANYRGQRNPQVITLAIRKYGKGAFERRKLDVASNKADLDSREKYWIAHYQSTDRERGYNVELGGSVSDRQAVRLFLEKQYEQGVLVSWNKGRKALPEEREQILQAGQHTRFGYGHRVDIKWKEIYKEAAKGHIPTNAIQLRCDQTQEIYPSAKAVGLRYGRDFRSILTTIRKGNRFPDGLTYTIVNPEVTIKGTLPIRKAVRCLETGEIYPSITAASVATGVSRSDIRRAVRHPLATAHGKHFQLV